MVRSVNSSDREVSAGSLDAFLDRVTALMPHLCRATLRHEENYVTRGELTLPQYWALELLQDAGPTPMTRIVEALRLKASTGTVFVDRLVRTKLVRRSRARDDRRVVLVELTERGRKALREIHEQKRRGMADVFQRLSAAERAQHLRMMEKLVGELSTEDRR